MNNSHLAERFNLGDLASLIHVSTDKLNDMFRAIIGMTPIHYTNYLRVQKAKTLLLQNRLTVKEIGHEVGFADPLYFSRVFKKIEGLSPTLYKASIDTL